METIRLNDTNIAETAQKAADVLRAGGVVLYPTDTLYGLGADALSDDAVARIVAVKGRDERKPIHAIVADFETADIYAEVTPHAQALIERFGGKVTLILQKKDGVHSGIAKYRDTFGFRIPDHEFCTAMCRAFGGPITATSANRADMRPELSADSILQQLGPRASQIDLVVDGGELSIVAPSTVVDLSGENPIILREAAVSADEIWSLLRAGA